MDAANDVLGYIWQKIRSLYNVYIMLFGLGSGAFCYFVDGAGYAGKGLKREMIAAKVTGAFLFVFALGLFIIVKIF